MVHGLVHVPKGHVVHREHRIIGTCRLKKGKKNVANFYENTHRRMLGGSRNSFSVWQVQDKQVGLVFEATTGAHHFGHQFGTYREVGCFTVLVSNGVAWKRKPEFEVEAVLEFSILGSSNGVVHWGLLLNLGSLDLTLVVAIPTVLVLVPRILIVGLAVVLHGRKTGWMLARVTQLCSMLLRERRSWKARRCMLVEKYRAHTYLSISSNMGDTPEVEVRVVLTLAKHGFCFGSSSPSHLSSEK
ncbi:hypothetical protein Tco_1361283 [Tanacetum coccineum]